MIRVVRGSLEDVEAEGVLRSVSSTLDPDTPFSRTVEGQAGEEMAERLRAMGELPVGAAVITPGGNLPHPFLIHVVLRSAEQQVSREGVRQALINGLRRAHEWELTSLLLPPLGVGPGALDAQDSADLMIPVLESHQAGERNPRVVTILVGTGYEQGVFTGALESARPSDPPRDH